MALFFFVMTGAFSSIHLIANERFALNGPSRSSLWNWSCLSAIGVGRRLRLLKETNCDLERPDLCEFDWELVDSNSD